MAWIYIPGAATSSPSAPEEPASISPLSWQFQVLERSVWWRGNPTPARGWFRLWKKASWLQRLCGAMPEPSTAASGVASWMASLAASRVSRGALPASSLANSTNAISGRPSGEASSNQARGGASSRMSPACLAAEVSSESDETFTAWASRLREASTLRLKLVRRTSAQESFSSGSAISAMKSSAWPTPATRDHKGANAASHLDRSTGSLHLDQLPNFVAHVWVPKLWSTPSVASATGGQMSRSGDRQGELLLAGEARAVSSLLGHNSLTNGEPTEQSDLTLNPRFVEALMGWPTGWTDFACAATELSRWKARMRSELLQLPLHDGAPAQSDLFG